MKDNGFPEKKPLRVSWCHSRLFASFPSPESYRYIFLCIFLRLQNNCTAFLCVRRRRGRSLLVMQKSCCRTHSSKCIRILTLLLCVCAWIACHRHKHIWSRIYELDGPFDASKNSFELLQRHPKLYHISWAEICDYHSVISISWFVQNVLFPAQTRRWVLQSWQWKKHRTSYDLCSFLLVAVNLKSLLRAKSRPFWEICFGQSRPPAAFSSKLRFFASIFAYPLE